MDITEGGMDMRKKTIVVVGAGSGLGNHIAEEFGRNGFKVILMARRENALKGYAAEMQISGIDADYHVVDCADNASIRAAFQDITSKYGAVDVLSYNTAVLKDGLPSELTPEELAERYQIDVAGGLCAAQQVIPGQKAQGGGSILFTGGGLAFDPVPLFASVSIHKAALRTLAITLHDELKNSGIYVGIVNIKGNIGSDDHYAPAKIAQVFYKMFTEKTETEVTY